MAIDSIRDLRLFLRVYEQASITGAAALLGITPALASKRLKRMEAQAGEALFHRSTRSLSPTGAGSALYESACAVVAAADQAEDQLGAGEEPAGLLKLTASIAFGRLYLTDTIAAFLALHRRARIDAQFTDRTVDMVEEGIDLAFRISAPLCDSPLVMQRLCSGRRILCASPAYLAARGAPRSPEDLRQHDCVILNHYAQWKLAYRGEITAVRVRGSYHSNDGEAVLAAMRLGLGVGVVALWHGGEDIANGRLVRVLPCHDLVGQPEVYAVYHPQQRHLPRLRRFLDFMQARLRLPFDDPDEFLARHAR